MYFRSKSESSTSSLVLIIHFLQDISHNHLKSAGAEYVAKMLLDSISLKSVKLSGNMHGTMHLTCYVTDDWHHKQSAYICCVGVAFFLTG